MEVPKRIQVNLPNEPANHVPAGYYDSDDESDDDFPPFKPQEPRITLMSPPETLTAKDIGEEERRRFVRDTSLNASNIDFLPESTPNDTLPSQNGDPISILRQVRHLHNRVKLLEEEFQTQQTRQSFLIGVVSLYILIRGINWMYK